MEDPETARGIGRTQTPAARRRPAAAERGWLQRLALLAAAWAIATAGCSSEERAESPVPADTRTATTPPSEEAPARATPALPAPGRATVEVRGNRVTVLCNDAELGAVLSDLSEKLDFALELDSPVPACARTRILDAPIGEVLPVLLAGLRYDTDFEVDPLTGVHQLRRLRVGSTGAGAAGEQTASAAPGATRERPALEDRRDAEARRRARAEDDDEDGDADADAREQLRWIDALTSSDPRQREEAAYEIEPEGRGLDALLGLLADDPDPKVRIAAASQLEDSDTHAAVEGLLNALDDPDREVVLEAIDALEFAGDESVVPRLEPLLDSRDEEVREAAKEAIDFLE